MRLKDKLGNRANASAEIEYHGAFALAAGRGGRRRAHHHRDGAPHPPRHRDGAGRADAGRALDEALWWCGGRRGLPAAADRPAADGERAGRPRARGRGGAGARAAGRARLRRRTTAPSPRVAVALAKFLNNKRCPQHDLRGDGVPRRRRLRRGRADAAALSRGAAELDLGGLGQRDLPRRAAHARGDEPEPASACWPSSPPRAA